MNVEMLQCKNMVKGLETKIMPEVYLVVLYGSECRVLYDYSLDAVKEGFRNRTKNKN